MRSTMSPEAKMEALAGIHQFSTCPTGRLASIAARAEEAVLAPGAVLVHEGQQRGPAYVILSGQVNVARGGRSMSTVGPGVVVGELSADPDLRAATITAITL